MYDGPPTGTDDGRGYLCVGYGADDDHNAIDSRLEWRKFGGDVPPRDEEADITCLLMSQAGETDMSVVRAQADGWMDLLVAALFSDLTLGGVVRMCWVASYRQMNMQTKSGAALGIDFRVRFKQQVS